jgi:peptide chain release factor 3
MQDGGVFRASTIARSRRCCPADGRGEAARGVELAQAGYARRSTFRPTGRRHLTPVYFGSALNNFGVRELLDGARRLAPPRGRSRRKRAISPSEPEVDGLRLQGPGQHGPASTATASPSCGWLRPLRARHEADAVRHRQADRRAQRRSCSRPTERELAEEAWAGDIIGIPNHGTLRIGDALTEGETIHFTGIPSFAPEYLRRVRPDDPMKAKHLGRALEQVAEEGAAQVFKMMLGSDFIVGVVGALQFDVLAATTGSWAGPSRTSRTSASCRPASRRTSPRPPGPEPAPTASLRPRRCRAPRPRTAGRSRSRHR